MSRYLAVALAALASAGFAEDRPSRAPQPGYGVVETIVPIEIGKKERSAAAGGSAQSEPARPGYRIGVRMADGRLEYRELDRPEFRPGDHVLLTNAGEVLPD
jgi:hypothetical protein